MIKTKKVQTLQEIDFFTIYITFEHQRITDYQLRAMKFTIAMKSGASISENKKLRFKKFYGPEIFIISYKKFVFGHITSS